MERTAEQRHAVELGMGRRDDGGVAVSEVHRRIRGQAVEIATALDVEDRRALCADRDHWQWRVVAGRVTLFQSDRRLRLVGDCRIDNRHGCTSNVQHLIDPPPLSSSDKSTPTGSKPASRS